MDNIEKVKRHLGRPIPVSFKNLDDVEDIFYFKPLNIEQQAILMELSKRMKNRPEIEVDGKKIPEVTKEDMIEMFEIMLDIVKISLGLEEEVAKDFTNTNFDKLSDVIFDLIPKSQDPDKIKLIKKKMEEAKSNEPTK